MPVSRIQRGSWNGSPDEWRWECRTGGAVECTTFAIYFKVFGNSLAAAQVLDLDGVVR
jgi:hypothetical protein